MRIPFSLFFFFLLLSSFASANDKDLQDKDLQILSKRLVSQLQRCEGIKERAAVAKQFSNQTDEHVDGDKIYKYISEHLQQAAGSPLKIDGSSKKQLKLKLLSSRKEEHGRFLSNYSLLSELILEDGQVSCKGSVAYRKQGRIKAAAEHK